MLMMKSACLINSRTIAWPCSDFRSTQIDSFVALLREAPMYEPMPAARAPSLLLLIPAYNEAATICELLDLSDRIREMILERRPNSEVKKAAHEEGMRFLRESAVEKVLTGLTTIREINKVTVVE